MVKTFVTAAGVLVCFTLFSGCAVLHPHGKVTPPSVITKEGVTVHFIGIHSFSEGDIQEAIADPLHSIKEQGLDAATADDAAFFLELFYRRNGFIDAKVTPQIEGANQLQLTVYEGARTYLKDIHFTGIHHAQEQTLKDYIIGAMRERQPAHVKIYPYVEADIDNGIDLIKRYYLAEGYLDAQVVSSEVAFSNDHSQATLTITIAEGKQYTFGNVELNGDLIYSRSNLHAVYASEIAQPYTNERVQSIARELEEFYKKLGYFSAKVEVQSDPNWADAAAKVPAFYTIEPGPLYRFDGTAVRGTDRLKPQFLRNRFRKLSGKIYNPDELDAVYQQMINTGLFEWLRITAVPQPDNTLRLDLDVKEAKSRDFGVSAGYSTFEGPMLGLEFRDRDFFGTGRPMSLAAEYSTRTLSGTFLYKDPYLFESNNQFNLRLEGLTRDLDSYTKQEGRGVVALHRPLTKNLRVGMFLQGKKDNITSLDILPDNAGILNYFANSAGVNASLDLRDNPFNPTRGSITTVNVDTGSTELGGDLDFVRATFRFSWLHTFESLKHTIAVGVRFGVVQPFGNTVTAYAGDPLYFYDGTDPRIPHFLQPGKVVFPIDERFFNGGANSVRSFVERTMGKLDPLHNEPIGGQAYNIFNVEYTFPFIPYLSDLRGAVFFDAGNLVLRANEFGFRDERYAIGGGLRYNLPIGALRLDYGQNPNPHRNEHSGAFHFAFGMAF